MSDHEHNAVVVCKTCGANVTEPVSGTIDDLRRRLEASEPRVAELTRELAAANQVGRSAWDEQVRQTNIAIEARSQLARAREALAWWIEHAGDAFPIHAKDHAVIVSPGAPPTPTREAPDWNCNGEDHDKCACNGSGRCACPCHSPVTRVAPASPGTPTPGEREP